MIIPILTIILSIVMIAIIVIKLKEYFKVGIISLALMPIAISIVTIVLQESYIISLCAFIPTVIAVVFMCREILQRGG